MISIQAIFFKKVIPADRALASATRSQPVPSLDIAVQNLVSPITLCFVLGLVAVALRSDLSLPEPVASFISLYLMLAIGLKGGAQLVASPIADSLPILAAGLALGCVTPLWLYAALRRLVGLAAEDAAAFAAHYGSVSAVTFIAAVALLERAGQPAEPAAAALLAIMEAPAIIVALALAGASGAGAGGVALAARRTLSSKSVVLLVGGLAIGAAVGPVGLQPVKPFFEDLFRGLLCVFLLDLGLKAAREAGAIGHRRALVLAVGVVAPLVNAALALAVAAAMALSVPAATILATLAASASYIVAPAAIRAALPHADAASPLAASIAVTFPFNLLIGLPLYLAAARWLAS
jgi:hypothetical protein